MTVNRKPNEADEINLPKWQRILDVLEHLNVRKAHIAARMPPDIMGLISERSDVVASLTLVCPEAVDGAAMRDITSPLLVITGDGSPTDQRVTKILTNLTAAAHVKLENYSSAMWSDMVSDRTTTIETAMLPFLQKVEQPSEIAESDITAREGEVSGISYSVSGAGPALVLLPLGLAPSQWDTILPVLRQHFCTIVLGGPELGVIPLLEDRGRAPGYLRLIRNMMDGIKLQDGEKILDVGCGTGVIDRWIASYSNNKSPITGVDLNAYLIREAEQLMRHKTPDSPIKFKKGHAEALDFPDETFDVVVSTTVMEEVDADQMLGEMIRVTKPGGRIGIIIRALDLPKWVNVPVSPELKAKIEEPKGPGEGTGCASASLYLRIQDAGLLDIQRMPDLTPFDNPKGSVERLLNMILIADLDTSERNQWKQAVKQAVAQGTFVLTWPHHCAVATKPVLTRS